MIYVQHGASFFDSQAIMIDFEKHTYQIDQNLLRGGHVQTYLTGLYMIFR